MSENIYLVVAYACSFCVKIRMCKSFFCGGVFRVHKRLVLILTTQSAVIITHTHTHTHARARVHVFVCI